jgi:hypothetical protein
MPSSKLLLIAFITVVAVACPAAAAPLRVAFGHVDITPEITRERPVFLAGYGQNRRAAGVHDPLYARAVVLQIGDEKIALVSVDLIGLQLPTVRKIRDKLPGFKYVMVSSTHNHEGPDVIGIWGPSYLKCGVDFRYLDDVIRRVAKMVDETAARLAPMTAAYGVAEDQTLLGDSRQPKVYDGVLRVVRFDLPGGRKPAGLLVQWNCHPEAMGRENRQITADFPWATVAALEKKYGCPVAYFSGAVGGLMAPPDHVVKNAKGEPLRDGDFEYTRIYGEMVARLAAKAIDAAQPIDLNSLRLAAKPISVPLDNDVYKILRALGVLRREGRVWTGDAETLGDRFDRGEPRRETAVETEVAYLRLGELHIACIPGELYPELVYGQYQDPVDRGADFPDSPLEKPVAKILPGDKWLLFGLANDEIGYIIPKRQWDNRPPYCYDRKKSQYGEINSCGPDIAPILMQALENRVREAIAK